VINNENAGRFDIASPGDLGDEQGILHRRPPKPLNFSVGLSGDRQHVLFRLKDVLYPQIRTIISEYRVYFISIDTISPSDIAQPELAKRAFAQAQLAGYSPPSSRPGLLEWESDRQWAGQDGWFFATTVNIMGLESDPTPPARAPGADSIGDSAVPGDVTAFQVTLRGEYVAGRSYVRVYVSAVCPTPLGSFDGYQIYLQGYRDTDFEDSPIIEGHFVQRSTQDAGDLLSDSFLMDPDVAVPYDTGTISITNASATVTGVGTDWSLNWGDTHLIALYASNAAAPAVPGLVYFVIADVVSPTQLTLPSAPNWISSTGVEYVIAPFSTQNYTADQPFLLGANYLTPHRVRMYAVSVSKAGTRRPDITNSPYVDFPFGLAAALTKPDNPYRVTAYVQAGSSMSSQGAAITLKWNVTKFTGVASDQLDSTLSHFNVYRQRAGTQNNPVDPAPAKPLSIYASVPFDRALSNQGQYTWTDKAFNTNPLNVLPDIPPTDSDAWDFNPADLGEYVYWIQAVNVEGTENRSTYWGTLTSAGGVTLTQTGGDEFNDDMVGKTITLSDGTPYTVETVNVGAGTLDVGAAVSAGTYDYSIGSVSGRIQLVGNQGSEGDPTLHGDDFFNRLFNSQFISYCSVAGTDEPIATDHNSGYAAAATLADGQPTFRRYFTDELYITGNTGLVPANGRQNAQAAGLPPTYIGGSPPIGATWDDNWSVWQYYSSTAAAPVFVCSDPASQETTGEVVVHDPGGATDFTALTQLIQKRKMSPGMPFALTFWAKSLAPISGAVILGQVVRYDARNFSNAAYIPNVFGLGIEREGTIGGTVSTSTLTTTYQRFTVLGRLPSGDPATRTGVTATNGSATIVGSGDFDQGWIGCTATVKDGANTLVAEIRQVNAGTGTAPDACTDIVLSANWTFATTANATVDVAITFTHYFVKIGVNGDTGGNDVYIYAPMLNSGLLGAPYNPTMVTADVPGGFSGAPGGPGEGPTPDPRPGCVPAGTKVWTPEGEREIQHIIPGSKVMAFSGGGFTKTKVVKANETSTRLMYRIATSTKEIECSESHLFRVDRRYVCAANLQLGDRLVGVTDGQRTTEVVKYIERTEVPITAVYSLSCEPVHNYVAGGLVCHNKPPIIDQ
jgi:hypothetical protein